MDGLWAIKKKYKQNNKIIIGRIRGEGAFIAVTVFNTSTRDKLIYEMRQRGVEIGGCGAFSIRLRPAMVFTPQHAKEFLRIFDEVLGEVEVVGDCESWDGDWDEEEPRNLVDLKTGEQGDFHEIFDQTPGIAIMGDYLNNEGVVSK